MELAALARWTPIAFDAGGARPTIDWCDLSDVAFTEPFFDQTVERAVADGRRVVRTDLDALLALDSEPSLEPSGMIFHVSRCGSTLVSRLFQTMNRVLVVVEPAPLNALLRLDPDRVDEATRVRVIRLLARALGRIRTGVERHFVLKLSSWNVRRAALLAAAFPDTPRIWLQRSPIEVVASLEARPPGWARDAATVKAIFDVDDGAAPIPAAVEAMLRAALAMAANDVLDYRDLPTAIWERLAPAFGIALAAADMELMRAQSLLSAKDAAPVRFDGARVPAPVLSSASMQYVTDRLLPLYDALDTRRQRASGPASCSS